MESLTEALKVPSAADMAPLAALGKLAQLAEKPKSSIDAYDNERWVGELKWDGWRLLVHRADHGMEMWSRNGKRYEHLLPTLSKRLEERLVPGTWLDCEAVSMTVEDGRITTSSAKVQRVLGRSDKTSAEADITLVAFDLLAHDGIDARSLPFNSRRSLLEQLLKHEIEGVIISPQVEIGDESFQAALAQGFEGIMMKERKRRYASGARGHGLVKLKPELEADVVCMGFSEGKSGFAGYVGAMIFGAWGENGLERLGQCSGMDMKTRQHMTEHPEDYIGQAVEITYLSRHPTGGFRSPQFKRLRADKGAEDCTMETVA